MDKKMMCKKILDFWNVIELLNSNDFPKYINETSLKNAHQKKSIYILNSGKLEKDIFTFATDNYPILDDEIEICIGQYPREKLYKSLYSSLGIEDERIENERGDLALCGFRLSTKYKYIENSFNISPLAWGISRCCDAKSKNSNLINVNAYEQINKNVNKELLYINDYQNFSFEEWINTVIDKICKYIPICKVSDYVNQNLGMAVFYIFKNENSKTNYKTYHRYESDLSRSYYLHDLQMLMNKNLTDSKIEDYICALHLEPQQRQIDITNDIETLKYYLHPRFAPLGKWPSRYGSNLMQQVSINLTNNYLSDKHTIFSVNGPPGSGKTTMLKEIIVYNIIERAKILSKLDNSDEVFTERKLSKKYDNFTDKYYELDRALVPYGILVASSNNKAVENISKELPISDGVCSNKALTDLFDIEKTKQTLLYDDVIQKDIYFTKLSKELSGLSTWGLISAPLGNGNNISMYYDKIISKFLFNNPLSKKIALSHRKTFKKAQNDFIKQLDKVYSMQNALITYADNLYIYDELKNLKSNSANIILLLSEKESVVNNEKLHLENINIKIKQLSDERTSLENKMNIFEKLFPKLFKTERNRLSAKKLDEIMELEKSIPNISLNINLAEKEFLSVQEQKNQLEQKITAKEEKIKSIEKNLLQLGLNFSQEQDDHINAVDEFYLSGINTNRNIQINPIWSNNAFNIEREKLFYYALLLQKEFVLSSERLRKNLDLISKMWGKINNKEQNNNKYEFSPIDKYIAYPDLFNSLFLISPVISTTFASVQSMLANVKEESSLGLLIVDEAGQATPQSVLGALYRCNRAVIVGDPKQIEPVVTIPKPILNLFNDIEIEPYKSKIISGQLFADILNPFGGYLDDDYYINKIWVGCPLKVHRRCISPMFDISNKLSYNDTMINDTPVPKSEDEKKFYSVSSKWFDISGVEKGNKNHFVKTQGDFVIKIISYYIEKYNQFPDLFIISPFTSVVSEMQGLLLSKYKNTPYEHMAKIWKKDNIGTVHTFQGQEAKEVIFLLGCDEHSKGAIKWVSNNIVNVAVTRAKYRLYIVGDRKLWSEASEPMSVVNEFLD